MRHAIVMLGLCMAVACSDSNDRESDEESLSEEYSDLEFGGESYEEYDERRDSYGGRRGSLAGRGCTDDCSGHQAGYEWAERKGIADPEDCGGRSWSFIEGCRAYAKEAQAAEEAEY